jgi:hypothetical protein
LEENETMNEQSLATLFVGLALVIAFLPGSAVAEAGTPAEDLEDDATQTICTRTDTSDPSVTVDPHCDGQSITIGFGQATSGTETICTRTDTTDPSVTVDPQCDGDSITIRL